MLYISLCLAWIAAVTLSSTAALASDIPAASSPAPYTVPNRSHDIELEIGGGAVVQPAYEGAREYEISPTGIFTLHYLWLPGLGVVKDGVTKEGFSFGPSFRYLSKRESNEYSDLRGLNDVNASFEVGGKFAYTFGVFRPWVAVRRGFGGHEGIVGETGLDLVVRPNLVTEITFGPRASFASSDYMRTYFGVTPQESSVARLGPYAPSGGFKGAGAELGVRYEFSPEWALVGLLAYERLISDAAKSPIVQVGDPNQITAKLGLTYRFALKLFR